MPIVLRQLFYSQTCESWQTWRKFTVKVHSFSACTLHNICKSLLLLLVFFNTFINYCPSVLCNSWLGIREVQTVCIWPSCCHNPKPQHLFPHLNPFWYQFTQVILEKRLLSRCSSISSSLSTKNVSLTKMLYHASPIWLNIKHNTVYTEGC